MADYIYIVWGDEDTWDSSPRVIDIYRSEKRAAMRSLRLKRRTDALREAVTDASDLPIDQYELRIKELSARYSDIFRNPVKEYLRFWYERVAVRP